LEGTATGINTTIIPLYGKEISPISIIGSVGTMR